MIVTDYNKTMKDQLFHSISAQSTSLNTTFLIHHLLYSVVGFLYSKRSFAGIIPDFYRKLIFNFLVCFSLFCVFLSENRPFERKKPEPSPRFLLFVVFNFLCRFISSHYKSHPRFQSQFVPVALALRHGLCPPAL